MNECCRTRESIAEVGPKEDGLIKEMLCRKCKTTWTELINPEAGPQLLEACKLLLWEINGKYLDVDRSALKTAIKAMAAAGIGQ